MNAVQFLRLSDQLCSLPADVQKTVGALARCDNAAAAAAAGGKGSDCWWSAEFFLSGLASHGVDVYRAPKALAPRTASLFSE
jgi:hypothetical protein